MKWKRLILTVFAGGAGCAHFCPAQSTYDGGLKWGAGVAASLLGSPVGTTLVGMVASHDVVSSGPLALQVEGAPKIVLADQLASDEDFTQAHGLQPPMRRARLRGHLGP